MASKHCSAHWLVQRAQSESITTMTIGLPGQGAGSGRGCSKLFPPFIIQKQFSPPSPPPAPSAAGTQQKVSCPNVLFILLNIETGSLINTGGC